MAENEFPKGSPERITIMPDDYHVPYAGTAEDGRLFFASSELFDPETQVGYVGVFLWDADGSFSEVIVDRVDRAAGLPPQQAAPSPENGALARRLAELGAFTLEAIEVAPFVQSVDGVEFGFIPRRLDDFDTEVEEVFGDDADTDEDDEDDEDDALVSVELHPGNVIAYYAPWDGEEYDT